MDLDPKTLQIALTIGFLILSLGIHEAAHAWMAWVRGDDTARSLGRMTLNPIAHIDPFMTIILPTILVLSSGMIFGGAKPVPVNYYKLKAPLRDMMLVALAGPVSNLVLAVVFLFVNKALIWHFGMPPGDLAPEVMSAACYVNMLLAIFNMIPVPPLDGSRVMAWLLPSGMRERYVGLERFGLPIVFVLFMTGTFQTVIRQTIRPVFGVVDFLSGGTW